MSILKNVLNYISYSLKHFLLFLNNMFVRIDEDGNTYMVWFNGKKITDD